MSQTKNASEISSREESTVECRGLKPTYSAPAELEQLGVHAYKINLRIEHPKEYDIEHEEKIVYVERTGTNDDLISSIGLTPSVLEVTQPTQVERSRKDHKGNFLKKIKGDLPYRRPPNQTVPGSSQARNNHTSNVSCRCGARSDKKVFDLEGVKNENPNYSNSLFPSLSFNHRPLKGDNYFGLVGVELNPGPPKKAQKSKAKTIIKVVKAKKNPPKKSSSKSVSFGAKVGGFLGDLAQKAIMGITGMGDYTVQNNTLFNGAVSSNGPPQFLSQGAMGTSRFMHREYVSDVNGSVGFNITTYSINPLQANLFPWFNLIATNYEQFKIHGLVFEFKTMSATAVSSTNTALGSVIMATQYNINDAPFSNKLQMDQYQYAVSTVPSCSAIHPLECKPGLGVMDTLFTYTGSTGDPRFSSFGNFSIATVGMQAASNIGELWVSFDIELIKPRLFSASVPTNPSFVGGVSQANVIPYTPADMFAAGTWTPSPFATIPITLGTAASLQANTLLVPGSVIGNYLLTVYYTLNVTGATSGSIWTCPNAGGSNTPPVGSTSPSVTFQSRLGGTGGNTSVYVGPVLTNSATSFNGASLNTSWQVVVGFAGAVTPQFITFVGPVVNCSTAGTINNTKFGIYLTPFEL